MDEIHTKSTSSLTALANDVVLRSTDTIRLIFRPTIVNNPRNLDATVRGEFLYQRKRKSDEWKDFETIPLTSVKSGEGYKLKLKSEELLEFLQGIEALRSIYREHGIPYGNATFVRSTPQIDRLRQFAQADLQELLSSDVSLRSNLFSKLFKWASDLHDPSPVIERVLELEPSKLQELNTAIGLSRIRNALSVWENDRENGNEEDWQNHLTTNSFVLEYIFSWPASVVQGKAYVGGKTVQNTNGNIVDFLMRNRLTQSAALIEIKTPAASLLGPSYRNTYNVGRELSGAIMQVLNYKHSLQDNFRALVDDTQELFDVFDPPCAVIIGDTSQLDKPDKRKAFELYRSQFPSVTIVTFDELFERARSLIALLGGSTSQHLDESQDDIPF